MSNLQNSHQPQLLRQLRQKTLSIQLKIENQTTRKKQNEKISISLQQQLQKILHQKQVQERKSKSLIVLLNELQQAYQQTYLDTKQGVQNDEVLLSLENSFLRFLLIRESEHIKDGSKVLAFLKQLNLDKNRNKAKQFIKKSNFIEGQSQIIAKLKSQINLFKNQNLQCKRKWYHLQQDTKSIENHNKLLSIQNQRQKTDIRQQYQDYLQRINEAKMKIVNYTQLQKQSIITDYFVKEMAILQQKRMAVEQQNAKLQYHRQNLKQELVRIQMENREFNEFFRQDQQGMLATKMRRRIDQLRDNLIEAKKKGKNTRGSKLAKISQHVRNQLKNITEVNDFMEVRVREQEDIGVFLDEKPIADFFAKILEDKDKILILVKQEENGLYERKKELQTKRDLLLTQLQNLQENISDNNWQNQYKQKQLWGERQNWGPKRTDWTLSKQIPNEGDLSGQWKKITKQTDKIFTNQNYTSSYGAF